MFNFCNSEERDTKDKNGQLRQMVYFKGYIVNTEVFRKAYEKQVKNKVMKYYKEFWNNRLKLLCESYEN